MSLYEIAANIAHQLNGMSSRNGLNLILTALHVPFLGACGVAVVAKRGTKCPTARSSTFKHAIASLYQSRTGCMIAIALYLAVFVWGLALVGWRVVSIIELGSTSLGDFKHSRSRGNPSSFALIGPLFGVGSSIWCLYTVWSSRRAG